MPDAYRTEAADNDLRDIAYNIGVKSGRPLTADRIIDELINCCDHLAALSPTSQMGTAAAELGRDVRLLSHRRWVVIFRYVDDGVLILRIVDGRQDFLAWKFG